MKEKDGILTRLKNRFKREPSGYDRFVRDINILDSRSYYSLNEDEMKIADYMLDRGYMYYEFTDGAPILYISPLGRDMIRERW